MQQLGKLNLKKNNSIFITSFNRNAIEELNAEASHQPSPMSNDHSSWVNFNWLTTMDLPLFYCDRSDLASPLVNRQQAVLQVLDAFSDSYDKSDPKKLCVVRPVVCFAGHMNGAGKTTFGKCFRDFLVINKEYIWQARSEQLLQVVQHQKRVWMHFTTIPCILKEFPRKGTRFAYTFAECICRSALSEFPNSEELLSEVLPLIPQGASEWLRKLMRVINKKYLFLFVDEIKYLGVEDHFQFGDLKSPSSKKDSSEAYNVFFLTLRPLFSAVFVFCVIAGRVDRVVLKQSPRISPMMLEFLPLDPLPCQGVHYIMEHSLYHQTPIQQILFPSNRQELVRYSRVIWDYTGGVPFYVSYVLSEWTKRCELYPEWRDLSVEDLVKKLGTIPMMDSLFVNLETIKPRMVAVFSTMLLVSAVGIPIDILKSHYYLWNLGFQSSQIVDICIALPQYVTSFNSSVSGDASIADTTYHPNAWNIFYDTFLSKEDGIFIPFSQYSKGPDLIIRLPKNVTEDTISPSQMTDSSQVSTFSSQQGPMIYLIGISLKCYHLAGQGVGLSHIKNETEKFLIPVAQQLGLKAKNIVVIQLVVSTRYTKEVTKQFTDHQNWVLNSGTYENDNGHIYHQSLSSAPISGSANEWLTIPSRCQLAVCSTTSVQSFFGPVAYSQLGEVFLNEDAIQTDSKLIPLSLALTSWLQGMLRDKPESGRVGLGMEMRSDANAMQVEYTREGSASGAEFDWKRFLSQRALLSEEDSTRYAPIFLRIFGNNPNIIQRETLQMLHLPETNIQKILTAVVLYQHAV
eukprot:jgi/Galph1/4368/GphlegSOOS_G3027.1